MHTLLLRSLPAHVSASPQLLRPGTVPPSHVTRRSAVAGSTTAPMDVYAIPEQDLRKVIGTVLSSTMSVPTASWSKDFVLEAVLAEVTAPEGTLNVSSGNSSSSSADLSIDENGGSSSGQQQQQQQQEAVTTAPADTLLLHFSVEFAALLQQYQEASAAAAAAVSESTGPQQLLPKTADKHSSSGNSSRRSKAARGRQQSSTDSDGGSKGSSSSGMLAPELAAVAEQLQGMFGQLLQDNYQEVEPADVTAFGLKLLQELQRLVEAAAAAQQEDVSGLCQLCEREMPLTKHHLIPRDVHKDFKKKGFSFAELQAGLMVCRPCHSAIHRAVPDNKELGLHFRTLEALQQHDVIARFASWARRQRVTSKADVGSAAFRYRR